jgi:hypothetical protein
MLDKRFEQERASRVDERLARVVRIIVDRYDGDVKAFFDSIRYRDESESWGRVGPWRRGAKPSGLQPYPANRSSIAN